MKYNIENNIDFYNELYTSLDNKSNNDENNNDLCLITNLPLVNNFVQLKCGHKFNYGPLYKDIFNHKKKFNNMEQIKTKLKQNQIRCPYCRNIQDELLPYYENFGYPKEHGVNFFDINKPNYNYSNYIVDSNNQCQYQTTIDQSGISHIQQCNHYGYIHSILKNKYNNDNKYCYNHRLIIVKELKDNDKKEKIKIKKEFMQQKIELKKMKVEEVKKLLNNNFCNVILKSGKYKGTQCSGKIFKDLICKRHFNLNYKADNILIEESEENIVLDKDIKI
jgi:hypothetical protein